MSGTDRPHAAEDSRPDRALDDAGDAPTHSEGAEEASPRQVLDETLPADRAGWEEGLAAPERGADDGAR